MRIACLVLLLSIAGRLWADGPADNVTTTVRRIPKIGVEVPPADFEVLRDEIKALEKLIDQATKAPELAKHLPDVLIYHKAVNDALTYQEFFDVKEFRVAEAILAEGKRRATALLEKKTPWLDQTGPVVRGYISKIDGSVQPYGLVVPANYSRTSPHRWRLDLWFHGRGEVLSELNFVNDRRNNPGKFTPPDTIVLHPYGRYCNANKFAGEIDTLEALAHAKEAYRIDDDRISVRGFSMGGAACWQFAVHYSDRWFAAAPGAGFSETPDFLKVFQKEELRPTWWEKKLWRWYDCTDSALNLANLPTVAYSGENDSQKQAADVMEAAMKAEGLELVHIIGPKTGHDYHPDAKKEIDRRIDALAEKGRVKTPRQIHFVTFTLRYNRMHWIEVAKLGRHWERAQVDAATKLGDSGISLKTKNVESLWVNFGPGECPFDLTKPIAIDIDGEKLAAGGPESDGSFEVLLSKRGGKWIIDDGKSAPALVKEPGLQGPIDDAFMDSFIFVQPTGKARHDSVDKWSEAELTRAIEHWRRHFRGVARVKKDTEITDEDMKSSNLILWGDPQSNAVMAKVIDKLPIKWDEGKIVAGEKGYSADTHALIAIYPNPLQPSRYIVLNSSFTFRDYAYLNNARQVAMLPDWAIVDLRTPAGNVWPGKIADADFFGENWEFQRTPAEAEKSK